MTNNAKKSIRVAIVTNRIPAYRFPVFKMMQALDWLNITIFVSMPISASSIEARHELTLRHTTGLNFRIHTKHHQRGTDQIESMQVPIKLPLDLLFYRPDVIIAGEFGPRSLLAYLISRIRRVPFILWSEEINETSISISSIQKILRRFLISRASGFMAWGQPACDYLKSWQVSDNKIYQCVQAVDNHYWQAKNKEENKLNLQRELNLVGKVFLVVGQLIARKGFDLFLLAWAALPSHLKNNNSILIVGSGDQEAVLKTIVTANEIPNVSFAGLKSMAELPKYYSAADVFVFPSLVDVWGLVVNEAMASGLPVLASKYAGASQGLVKGSKCGELFDPINSTEFIDVLQRWCEKDIDIEKQSCQAAVAHLNFNESVKTITKLITDLYPSKNANTSL